MARFAATLLVTLAGQCVLAGVMRWQVGTPGAGLYSRHWAIARCAVSAKGVIAGVDIWTGERWSIADETGGYAWFDATGFSLADPELFFVRELVIDTMEVPAETKDGPALMKQPVVMPEGGRLAVSAFNGVAPTSYVSWNSGLASFGKEAVDGL